MFVINEDNSIYVTRGDILFFDLVAQTQDGTAYIFEGGDVLRMRIFKKKDCNSVVMLKEFVVESNTESVAIRLEKADTKFGDIINKPTDYWYEIELNPDTNPQTIVGYDDDGPKLFKLLPEGKEITEGELDEDIKSDVQKIIENAVVDLFLKTPVQDAVDDYMKRNPLKDGKTPYIKEGYWWIGGSDTGVKAAGIDGRNGIDGTNGITPRMRINPETEEWEVSYDNGVTYESTGVIARGEDGKDGKNGTNGVTFTPSVDASGNLSWTNDGGQVNPTAVNIRGRDGEDGYTPVKGTDYFTEEEKEEIVEEIAENSFGITTTAVDFSNWGNGSFVETLSDGTQVTHTITSDANGVITQIDDMAVSGVNA